MVMVAAAPVSAGSGSASLSGVQVSYSVPDTVAFDGPGCATVPWTLTWSKPANRGFDWRLEARQQGSNSAEDSDSDYQFYWDPITGTATGTLCVGQYGEYDPANGPVYLGGSIKVVDDNDNVLGSASLLQTPVNIKRNLSSFKKLVVRSGKPYTTRPPRARGRVVATTMTKGTIGAEGTLTLQVRRKGAWRTLGTVSLDGFGRFNQTLYKRIRVTEQIRGVLTGCGWCSDTRMVVGAD